MAGRAGGAAEKIDRPGDGDRLSHRDFARLAKFIEGYSGIKMPTSKMTMVEGRLRRRVRATGLTSVTDYCCYLFDQGGLDDEAVYVIDAITTNKTEFFREPEHFRILTNKVLPEIASKRRINIKKPLKVWSAACSTGAEPYTLAMVIADFAQNQPGFHAQVLGTDLCTEVLGTAVTGVYPEAMIMPVPIDMRRRHLLKSKNSAQPKVRIVPNLRAMATFGRLNLIQPTYPVDKDMDVIFCRNILIYFDRPTQEAVLGRLCDHLRPGGYLFLGHSESLAGLKLPVIPTGNTVFQRV